MNRERSGWKGMFRQFGIYAHAGQLYEPVDRTKYRFIRKLQDGQILEEGHYRSGFDEQLQRSRNSVQLSRRQHDSVLYLLQHVRFPTSRRFDLGRCGHASQRILGRRDRRTNNAQWRRSSAPRRSQPAQRDCVPDRPCLRPGVCLRSRRDRQEGLQRMFDDGEQCIYYITAENDNYVHPDMPEGCEEGIIKGMYKFKSREVDEAESSRATVRQRCDS